MNYEPVIGLEVHVELATLSKMFCGCPADHFGKKPNTQTCPVCLGFPGALPVPNKKAVEWTILLGLALGCHINEASKFDRKNYFYPDIPKGYQISQYDEPMAVNGALEVAVARDQPLQQGLIPPHKKKICISRVHLEEDTGKLMHEMVDGERVGLVDFNRSGVPLVEIVTAPDFHTIDEVDEYVKKLQQIIRYTSISGADMEKGTMRIEPSISIRKSHISNLNNQPGSSRLAEAFSNNKVPPYRVEIKNINSFKFVRRALEYEIKRQSEILDKGQQPIQETRGWSEEKNATIGQRDKEEASDYRYFPEPDIPPMHWNSSQLSAISHQLAELPDEIKARFIKSYGLSEYDTDLLIETREKAEYFEKCVACQVSGVTGKMIANWIINKKLELQKLAPEKFIETIAKSLQVADVSDEEIQKAIDAVVSENARAVDDYKKGKEQSLMFLFGQTLKKLKGKGDKQHTLSLLKSTLAILKK